MNNYSIILHEHQPKELNDEQRLLISTLIDTNEYRPDTEQYLGIDWDQTDRRRKTIRASYYVGTCWLNSEIALEIVPKIQHLDYMQMFMCCLDSNNVEIQNAFSNVYGIDFDAPLIDVQSQDIQLTPILMVHFLKLLEHLVRRGLKSNFVQREETMCGKTRGKIMLAQTIRRQLATGRRDINICQYQEYNSDCIENRILKKALVYTFEYLKIHPVSANRNLLQIVHHCLPLFSSVSDQITTHDIQHFRINPLFKEYAETLKIAKYLLRRFDYSIDNATDAQFDHKTPPFWINMPILFELYVLSKLRQLYSDIRYQWSVSYNRLDYCRLSERLIIDAKYKPQWDNSAIVMENVRQLSGYARLSKLRYMLGVDDKNELPCLILYPSRDGIDQFTASTILREAKTEPLRVVEEFYKLPIRLPIIQ
ncbi:MAG: McrC family protein [Paludibacteraceae bacterium]|nr:McrC family protein [Paludibacteraceae bacterium]